MKLDLTTHYTFNRIMKNLKEEFSSTETDTILVFFGNGHIISGCEVKDIQKTSNKGPYSLEFTIRFPQSKQFYKSYLTLENVAKEILAFLDFLHSKKSFSKIRQGYRSFNE